MTDKQCLYRFWDHNDNLLYVGITISPENRWKQHSKDKPWWSEVARITIEEHPNRKAVLNAERSAIIAENPRYNVVHNGPSKRLQTGAQVAVPVVKNQWIVRSRRSGYERVMDLYLDWGVSGTSISDNYTPDEITASELLRLWTADYGTRFPPIYWFIPAVSESAPFQRDKPAWGNFLDYYDWPRHAVTGERLNFNTLPVLDQNWSIDGEKGGFFQEATGWKPSPLQSDVDLEQVYKAAGIGLRIPEEVTTDGMVQGR